MEKPWERAKKPPSIPDPPSRDQLARLSDEDFAALLRSHLAPPGASGPARQMWNTLWATLTDDDDLRDRTYDTLEDFLDATEDHIAAAGEQASPRARKFTARCEEAWSRLERDDLAVLRRTAVSMRKYHPAARAVIDQLVAAIADHRATVTDQQPGSAEDHQLWEVLSATGLDPNGPTATPQPRPAHPPRRLGDRLAKFNTAARIDIEHLVGAIADHRATVTDQQPGSAEDHQLWEVLSATGLDPGSQ